MGRVTIEIGGVEYVACRGYGDQVIFSVGQRGRRFRALCGEALWAAGGFAQVRREPLLPTEALEALERAAKAQWMM